MVHLNPGHTVIVGGSVVRDLLTALLLSKLDCLLLLAVEINQALLGEDAFAVNAENLRRLEVTIDRSIAQNLLHKLFL